MIDDTAALRARHRIVLSPSLPPGVCGHCGEPSCDAIQQADRADKMAAKVAALVEAAEHQRDSSPGAQPQLLAALSDLSAAAQAHDDSVRAAERERLRREVKLILPHTLGKPGIDRADVLALLTPSPKEPSDD